MRTLLFLAFMAGFATLGYIYAPRLIEDNYRPTDESGAQVAQPEKGGVAMASPVPMQTSVKEITRQPPEAPRAVKRQPAPQTKSKKQKRSAAADSGEPLDRIGSKDVERVTGLRPLNGEVKNVAEVEKRPALPRKQEPLKSRWIDDLSGAKVRFEKNRTGSDGCEQSYSNCERPDAPKDISVAGVVVKTERLAKEPKRPLDGNVEQGNYIDHTPAVYVE